MSNSQNGNLRKNFHQARWDEPIIYEMSSPGVRGILTPEPDQDIKEKVGDVINNLPNSVKRNKKADLPEVSQKHVLMHYKHLAQETMGSNITNDISEGTCTMKYNPRINEDLVKNPKISELHPLQDESTVQGILKIYYRMEQMFCEITGMDRATFQPGGGNHAVYNAASIVRAYHEANGEGDQRDEIITTIYSHPCNAASPDTAGYKVITIYPDEKGFPDIEAIKEAASERTAAIFMTNPEDIGLYNPQVDEIVKIIKDVGGLCYYDQANANAFLGIARARDAGFDMCHFNLHKTFGTPHGSSGPGNGAFACREDLAKFLPTPTIEYDGQKYYLNYYRPDSYGKVRDFYGTAGVVLRAYAWIRAMGAEGLRETSEVSVINNNYLYEKLMQNIPELDYCYSDNGHRRQEQVRYTWEKLKEKTGIGTVELHDRVVDYGVQHYWESHEPWVIPEPMTLEPCETYSKDDLDEYVDLLRQLVREAYESPEMLKNAPHRAPTAKRDDESALNDPNKWAITWRGYQKKYGKN